MTHLHGDLTSSPVALTRSSNEFWLSKNQGRSSCPKREDIVLGRKGHGARVTTGLGFSFPFFSSQRPSLEFVKLPLKWRQLRSHWGILILCSDHWPFSWRFWFRRVGGRRSLCLMSIPRDSVIVGWQESFGKVQKLCEKAALSASSTTWLLCPFYRR